MLQPRRFLPGLPLPRGLAQTPLRKRRLHCLSHPGGGGGTGHGEGQWSVVTSFPLCRWQGITPCLRFPLWMGCWVQMPFPLSPWHRDPAGGCLPSDACCAACAGPSAVPPCRGSPITWSSHHPSSATRCLQTPLAPEGWQSRRHCPAHTGAGRAWAAGDNVDPGQHPLRSPLAAGTPILAMTPCGVGHGAEARFCSMVPSKRGEVLLPLGCCVCVQKGRGGGCVRTSASW